MSYVLPSLPYDYDGLEPYFDKITMEIHHTKHHQTYVNNANSVLQSYPYLDQYSVEEMIKHLDMVPIDKRIFMRNNAGGHANHSFFWKNLKIGTILSGNLKDTIERDFGSVIKFKEDFEQIANSRFGSGWTWLVIQNNKLVIVSTANQDSPLMGEAVTDTAGFPIIALDLWEHAYYLKYQNKRSDYIKAFWNVVNWDEAAVRFISKK